MTERYSPSGPTAGLPLVLLAGNGEDATRWLKGLLEGAGYAVLQERTAHHAHGRARTTDPDVLLVDQVLPDMAGIELCRALRADPHVSNSTPILLSFREPATRTERLGALRAGAWECIAPPHDADEILLKIGAYVHAKLDADRARAEGLLDYATRLYNRQGLARRARELGAQAYRDHGALACIVFAFDVEPSAVGAPPGGEAGAPILARRVQALTSAARLSDAIGRLSGSEFAILAPGTDAAGARRLAERLAASLAKTTTGGPPDGKAAIRVRCGYEAVSNVGYAPIEPMDLLVRAAAAVRTGRADADSWLRRFEEGSSTSPV